MPQTVPLRLVLAGVTGAVGQQLLMQLLASRADADHADTLITAGAQAQSAQATSEPSALRRVDSVQCWTRKALPVAAAVDAMPLYSPFAPADVAICTLGTTLKQAGSRASFYAVDYQLVLDFANAAYQAGSTHFILLSSLGADPKQRQFYLHVKGQIEQAIKAVGFASVSIVRPSLLLGAVRPERRVLEQLMAVASRWLGPLIPLRYRPVPVSQVASFLLALAKPATIGTFIYENWEIHQHHATSRLDRQ